MSRSSSARSNLTERWHSPEGARLSAEVVRRLQSNKKLGGLGLGEHDGRVDLRGFTWSPHTQTSSGLFGKWRVEQTAGLPELRSVRLDGLDLSWSAIERPLIFTSTIRDCRFEGARLRGMKLWAVDVQSVSFRAADLRDTVLGATLDGRWNTFERVEFTNADLRGTITPEASFRGCDFSGARLDKVEFQSDFVDCRFGGPLDGVIFHSRSWPMPGARPGTRTFENVDFGDAEFHWVEFRGFDLDTVTFPSAPGHVIVDPLRCSLERAIEKLNATGDHAGLVAVLELTLANAGPNQRRAVFDVRALREAAGAATEPVEQLLVDGMRDCISSLT
jgi:uncharacterized protein YjbI with pentapeptide repeats